MSKWHSQGYTGIPQDDLRWSRGLWSDWLTAYRPSKGYAGMWMIHMALTSGLTLIKGTTDGNNPQLCKSSLSWHTLDDRMAPKIGTYVPHQQLRFLELLNLWCMLSTPIYGYTKKNGWISYWLTNLKQGSFGADLDPRISDVLVIRTPRRRAPSHRRARLRRTRHSPGGSRGNLQDVLRIVHPKSAWTWAF